MSASRLWYVLLAGLVGAIAGCSGTTLEEDSTFDGQWSVETLIADGQTIDLGTTELLISIVTTEAAVEGLTACGPVLGSYTLENDGTGSGLASFTMPGGAESECDRTDRSNRQDLLEVLENVTLWQQAGDAIEFSRPSQAQAENPQRGEDLLVLNPVG